jgi:hypothetical protein
MVWIGLIWLTIGTSGELLWRRKWTFGFHKMLGTSWVGALLTASQEGLSSISEWIVASLGSLRHWRWRLYVPPKRWWTSTGLQKVTTQKTTLFAVTSVSTQSPPNSPKNWNFQYAEYSYCCFLGYDTVLWRVGWYTPLIRRVIVRMIGFISRWVTHPPVITLTHRQRSAIAHLHPLQFTVAHALGFCLH